MQRNFAREADYSVAVRGCDICIYLISTTLPNLSNADPLFSVETNIPSKVRLLNVVTAFFADSLQMCPRFTLVGVVWIRVVSLSSSQVGY